MTTGIARWMSALLMALTWAIGAGSALAANDPTQVSFTLEGCRNNGTINLPNNDGKFVCPDSAYTTGNLGKGWNELDLVPFRLTAKAGNSAPATQTYAVAIALDNIDAGRFGYDVIGSDANNGWPVLNTALSTGSCSISATGQLEKTPGVGGISTTIYRILTIEQSKNSTCVYDWYGRLALGSHLFPGSSLHANLLNQNLGTAGIGAKDVSIPVKEILPQELRKDMSATADSEVQWNLTKEANPTSINFGNVCEKPGEAQSRTVTFRVEWIKTATVAGGVNFVTNIYAKNPAHRTITVEVTDRVYKGTTQDELLHTLSTPAGGVDVPAGTEVKVLTHSGTLPASAGGVGAFLNDVATATYTDKVTNIIVPGTTTAAASAQIGAGVVTNAFAAIADSESITGTGLKFSVAQPAIGAFVGYTAGTQTTGPVDWGITGETSGRYVDFVKTVYLDTSRVTSGTLTDTAVLVASPPENGFTKTAGPIDVAITSSASVQLTVSKTIPPIQMAVGQKIEVTFRITRASDPSYQVDRTLEFANGETSKSTTLTGLVPDSYTVTEHESKFWNGSSYQASNLVIQGSSQQTKNLTAGADGIFSAEECAATASFVNVPAGGTAVAQVQKITDPANDSSGDPWTFTLAGPGGPVVVNTVTSGGGYVEFPLVLQEGNYTVTETTKGPEWLLISAAPDANSDKVCEFTVDYPADFGKTFSCTFTNQKQGKGQVVKTVNGVAPTGTQAFAFQLRQGASLTQNGTTLESGTANAGNGGTINFSTWLVPGTTYQMCEVVMPGWTTTLGTFVPASFLSDGVTPNPDVDNSILCANFTVEAGGTKVFTVDNTPPPEGRALTIGFWKNWASCSKSSGKQAPVLDQTLAKVGSIVVSATGGEYPSFTGVIFQVQNCNQAVSLLDKSRIDNGRKSASDPAFNLAAQLVAAQLNYAADAGKTPAATTAINEAVILLGSVNFNGSTHGTISKEVAAQMNALAKILDDYNNNK